MKQRTFLFLAASFFLTIFFIVIGSSSVSAAEYCSHDYSGGVGVGRCERYLSSYNPWRYLSSSEKQLRSDGGYVVRGWPTVQSGKQGTRYCIGGVCASFFPKIIETKVKTGEANKDALCKGFGPNRYTTCADVTIAVQGKPVRYEWGSIIRTNGTVPKNWNAEYYYYYYYPQNYKYSSTYPCGYWSGYASMPAPKPYYAPGQYTIQTLSKTANMPDVYNFHTEYLHLSQGVQLCVLRLFTDSAAYQDNWVWLTPQWPSPAKVTRLTANGSEGSTWIAPGDSVTIDWTTDRATQVDVSSSQNDIPENLNDPYNYNGNIYGLTPRKDATYRVNASNSGGSDSKSVQARINKPVILGFTANGVRDKIVIFIGQEVRFDWGTDSAEEIWINGFSDSTNAKIKTYTSGNATGLKPGATTTYKLRAWNQQWGFADEQSVTVEVRYLDVVKAIHCGADSALKGVTTGVTLGFQWGAVAAFVGSIIPGAGTVVGGVGGFVAGIVSGGILGVVNFVTCYFFDYSIGPDIIASIQGGIIKGGLSVQGTPSFTAGIQNPPPSWTPPACPSCDVTPATKDLPPPPGRTIPPSGWALVYDGGADPVSNALQKRNAEIGAWKYGTEEVSTLQALKDQGIQYVKVLGSLPRHETVQEIRGLCGRLISCLTNRMNATLGYPNGDASSQTDIRKKWTDSDVKKIFGIP
ncbi:MAG: hypothetical protein Q8P56_03580 [Candidatus Uhrbacteria bacterium]|nr:hypothetical protein [Candidatus Uhrbacteria bacterium]